MKIVTAAQMQALDRRAITEAHIPSLTLMANAGTSVVAAMEQIFGSWRFLVIYTLAGVHAGERCVIERTEREHLTRTEETSAANDWLIHRASWEDHSDRTTR